MGHAAYQACFEMKGVPVLGSLIGSHSLQHLRLDAARAYRIDPDLMRRQRQ
jgi:hypothetical protein